MFRKAGLDEREAMVMQGKDKPVVGQRMPGAGLS
jgi:hypothetical protein